jgi:hypothetical protein
MKRKSTSSFLRFTTQGLLSLYHYKENIILESVLCYKIWQNYHFFMLENKIKNKKKNLQFMLEKLAKFSKKTSGTTF